MIGSRVSTRSGVEDFQKWKIGLGESDHGVDDGDFDIGGEEGGEQGGLEVLHGEKEKTRIKNGEVEGKGFVAYGNGKKRCGGVEREKKNSKNWRENDVGHYIGVFVVGCESYVNLILNL